MRDVIRESSIGQLARLFWPAKLPYPEELDGFELPADLRLDKTYPGVEKMTGHKHNNTRPHQSNISRPREATIALQSTSNLAPQQPHEPAKLALRAKLWVTTLVGLYTFAVYIGSSLYAPSEAQITRHFGVSPAVAELGIALYVVGYGVGPLLWSPLSEIPRVGRTSIYIATFFVFVWLALGAALVPDGHGHGSGNGEGDGTGDKGTLAALLALRFLLDFFGSPCLATAGATLDDMFAPWKLGYVLCVWSSAATLGPALGPVISGFAVSGSEMGWRISQWELLWLAAPIWLLMALTLPETNPDTILHRKATRLRALTHRPALPCAADIRHQHQTPRQILTSALLKPWAINFLDPAVAYTTIYSAVLYGTYYSFFAAFPLVFGGVYGFALGVWGLPFLAFVPGLLVAVPVYAIWFRRRVEPVMRRESPPLYGCPEGRLFPAVVATFLAPGGLFIFACTSSPKIHPLVPTTGLFVFFVCIFVVYQCMFFYLARCYPRHSASLFAANDFARSSFAAASLLFSAPMYRALGVAGGLSLLGGLASLCAAGMLFLYLRGHRLRARSRFAQSS
ncbi:Uu.00g008430.m01.CDS01 [Anthostomella pinea]|uniref:Uu.00g008430.m01.CDS01 n=1 Tax=Anthostomella pinea TaxID=933095 RepID=A0AAI8YPS9_9PEZI|nr:Uu.00g008430.m01.CDS01 [Anthostomella pinea]